MSPEAAHNLSIRDLLRVLSEKLGLECTRIRDIPPSHVVSAAELEAEVSTCRPMPDPMDVVMCLTPVGLAD